MTTQRIIAIYQCQTDIHVYLFAQHSFYWCISLHYYRNKKPVIKCFVNSCYFCSSGCSFFLLWYELIWGINVLERKIGIQEGVQFLAFQNVRTKIINPNLLYMYPTQQVFLLAQLLLNRWNLVRIQDTMFRCANYMYKEIQIPLFFRKYCPIYSLNFDHLSNKVMNSLKVQLLLNHCMEFGKTYVFRT